MEQLILRAESGEENESLRSRTEEIDKLAQRLAKQITADILGDRLGNVSYLMKDFIWMYLALKSDDEQLIARGEYDPAKYYKGWTKRDIRQLVSSVMECVGHTRFISAMHYKGNNDFYDITKDFEKMLNDINGIGGNNGGMSGDADKMINLDKINGIIALIKSGATEGERIAAKEAYRRLTGKDYSSTV